MCLRYTISWIFWLRQCYRPVGKFSSRKAREKLVNLNRRSLIIENSAD